MNGHHSGPDSPTLSSDPIIKTNRTVFSGPDSDIGSPPFVKRYSYEELDSEPGKKSYSPTSHGFSYESSTPEKDKSMEEHTGSGGKKKGHAHAFNYAPGEAVEKKASLGSSPASVTASGADGAEYVMSAKNKEKKLGKEAKPKKRGFFGSSGKSSKATPVAVVAPPPPPGSPSSAPSSPDNTLPDTSLDESSQLDASFDSSVIDQSGGELTSTPTVAVTASSETPSKLKKDKKVKKEEKKKVKKGKDAAAVKSDAAKNEGKDKKSADKKKDKAKKKGKVSGGGSKFGGLFGKKTRRGSSSSSSQSSVHSTHSLSDHSDSDESVVKVARNEPTDIDASIAASEKSFLESSATTAADRSGGSSLLTNAGLDHSTNAADSDRGIISPLGQNNSFGPKIVKTTTKKTFVQDDGGVAESFTQQVEDDKGQVSLESHGQKVILSLNFV